MANENIISKNPFFLFSILFLILALAFLIIFLPLNYFLGLIILLLLSIFLVVNIRIFILFYVVFYVVFDNIPLEIGTTEFTIGGIMNLLVLFGVLIYFLLKENFRASFFELWVSPKNLVKPFLDNLQIVS